MTHSTQADRGFINQPGLTPHLQYHILENDQVLLVSEFFNTLLHGNLYCRLLPLLDGLHTLNAITAELDGIHPSQTVLGAVYYLSSKGYIVSFEHGIELGKAAYWSTLGASPRWVEQQLINTGISIDGDDGQLTRHFQANGVNVSTENTHLKIVVCNNYLEARIKEINEKQLAQKLPWTLVRPFGIETMFGPIFGADGEGACWNCLASRMRCHQEVHEFLRGVGGEALAFKPNATNPDILDAIISLTVAEITKWLVLGKTALINDHVITLNTGTSDMVRHRVMRRPQCLSCGDEMLFDPHRSPVPLQLNHSPKTAASSTGSRSEPPEITLENYKHLVSPISGVVTWLSRTSDEKDSWLHVYWAGSNPGLKINKLSSLRRSLRSKSAGKGSNSIQSKVSALCEAIERYSGGLLGDEITLSKSFEDFATEDEAIHPNTVQLFSDRQLNKATEINSEGHPYNIVPPRFNPEIKMNWTPVWSLTQQRHRYLPTSMLYIMPPEFRTPFDMIGDSNGCAAGNTLEEAILQGFYELVERDAFAIWWYNQLQFSSIDLAIFEDGFLNNARKYYQNLARDIWVLDITSDIAIPTFVAISNLPGGQSEDIIYGSGAHPDAKTAVLRAVCELNQCLTWLPRRGVRDGRPMIDDPMALAWWKNAKLKDCSWLVPAKSEQTSSRALNLDKWDLSDLGTEVKQCQTLVEEKGSEFLVLDQTRPDIGLPVVRVIVPGLRHFWERLAPGRLYEVPVQMGFQKVPLKESEMNKSPMIG